MQPITADRWRRALGEVTPVDAESLAESLNALLTVTAQVALHRKQIVLIQCRLGGPTADDQRQVQRVRSNGGSAQEGIGIR